MTQKYGVSLSGFQEESTLVKLDGLATGVAGARHEIDSLLTQFQKSIVAPKIPLSANLLTSAKKRFKNERIAACLLPSQGRPDVAICSFSPDDHERAVKIMCSKPSVRYVPFQPHPSLRALPLEETATEFSVIVEVNEGEQKIYVRGFVHEDVVSARQKISSLVQATLVQFSPIVCTPEQMLYLRSKLRSPNEATQHALDALPAKVISERNRPLHFRGSPMDIESAQTQIIEGPLFQGLKHHSKTFKAHPKSYYQIEDHILRPMKEKHPDFVYNKRDHEGSGKESSTRMRGSTKAEESSFTVTILSQNSVVFDEVLSELEAVSPCVKTLNIKYRNELPCVQERKEVTEKQYRVRILIRADSSTVLIFGLTEGEARQCLNNLREHIDSTITVQKFIKLDRNQFRYMQQKKSDDWQDLKRDCTSFELLDKRRQETDTVLIRVEGTVQQVKAVEQGLTEMMGGNYFVKTFKLEVQKRHNRMWLKHWKAIIKEKEESHDFIITFTRKEMAELSEENKSVEYEFTMCGCEEDGTNEVEEEIRRKQTTDKIIELSPEATKALYTGMTEKQLHVSDQYTVNMFIDTRRNRVVLTAPEECRDDLEAAEEEIHKFVGNRTTMEKEIPIDDPVIGVILRSKAKSLSHLAHANRLSKPLGVSVQCLRRPRCGLLLRGSQDAILKVEPLVHTHVISQIQSTVDELKIPVDPLLLPFFSTTEFTHFKSKLQEDLCVVGTFPTLKKPNQVIKSVYLQTTSSASCIKLDISSELSDTPDQSPETMRKKAVVTLRGPQANLPLAKSKLDDKLKNALKSNDIPFPAAMEGQILVMVQRQKISFTIRNADQIDQKGRKRPTKVLTIKGLSHLVHKATSAVQEEIISYQTAAPEESGVEVPPDWQPQTQNLEKFAIARGSLEWNKVESHFKTTLPSVAVLQITRLQNKWLWERYAQHKRRLEYKNSGNVNERELFHGTRNNDPRVIYEGEDGFDMRYSAQGMWGLANYFAVNASYSHAYAYAKSDGSRQMFLVKVLTGDSHSSTPNRNLRMPPEKQSGAGGKLQFATPRYDTVTGNTGGSQVFMAYDNDKAYPAYLIQYK